MEQQKLSTPHNQPAPEDLSDVNTYKPQQAVQQPTQQPVQQPVQPGYYYPPQHPVQPPYYYQQAPVGVYSPAAGRNARPQRPPLTEEQVATKIRQGVISLTLSIISVALVAFALLFYYLRHDILHPVVYGCCLAAIPLGVIGIILGAKSQVRMRKPNYRGKVGMILSIFAVASAVVLLCIVLFVAWIGYAVRTYHERNPHSMIE